MKRLREVLEGIGQNVAGLEAFCGAIIKPLLRLFEVLPPQLQAGPVHIARHAALELLGKLHASTVRTHTKLRI